MLQAWKAGCHRHKLLAVISRKFPDCFFFFFFWCTGIQVEPKGFSRLLPFGDTGLPRAFQQQVGESNTAL